VRRERCLRRAELASDQITGAEWVDLSTHWHWLARQKEFDQPSVEDIEFA